MNRYLEAAMAAGVRGDWMKNMNPSRIHNSMHQFQMREVLTKKFAWAIPTDAALEMIRKYAPLIEIGAGKGYWASLLGCDIICFDCHANNPEVNNYVDLGENYFKVLRGGVNRVEDYPERTLFLCWPPYDTSMAADCLEVYTGQKLVFIGEGNGGCTAGDGFWDRIDEHWEEEEDCELPQWYGMHDWLTVYRRIPKLTKQEIRAVLDDVSIKHTNGCRESPGNVKGSGGHWPPNGPRDMGGYRCVCDWMDRVRTHHKEMKK